MLYLIIAIVSWGLWAFFNKLSCLRIPAIASQIIINIFFIFETPILIWHFFRSNKNIYLNSWGIFFASLAAITGMIASLSFAYALQKMDVGLASGYAISYVAIVYLLSVFFLKEQFSFYRCLGIITILFGTYLLGK